MYLTVTKHLNVMLLHYLNGIHYFHNNKGITRNYNGIWRQF